MARFTFMAMLENESYKMYFFINSISISKRQVEFNVCVFLCLYLPPPPLAFWNSVGEVGTQNFKTLLNGVFWGKTSSQTFFLKTTTRLTTTTKTTTTKTIKKNMTMKKKTKAKMILTKTSFYAFFGIDACIHTLSGWVVSIWFFFSLNVYFKSDN